jgi:membrane associated rhomboid family serine protease
VRYVFVFKIQGSCVYPPKAFFLLFASLLLKVYHFNVCSLGDKTMLEKLAAEVQSVISAMGGNLLFSIEIIGIMWAVHIVNFISGYSLNNLGIRTRKLSGLAGILFSPILHGDFNHLFFNTIPLFVLSDLVLLDGRVVFYCVSLSIIILSGFLIWLLGQRGTHIGASSLIMGYFGYLLARAYFHVTGATIILAGVCIYYFGGLLLSVFPGAKKNVSWEGHIMGMLSGVFVAYFLPYILKINSMWHIFSA